MLLSFNKCSISALTASIYQSVNAARENLKFYPQRWSELQCVSPIIGRFVCIKYHVILRSALVFV